MRKVLFHSEAEAEMIDAATHYEGQQENLGKRFLLSVQETVGRIQINPTLSYS